MSVLRETRRERETVEPSQLSCAMEPMHVDARDAMLLNYNVNAMRNFAELFKSHTNHGYNDHVPREEILDRVASYLRQAPAVPDEVDEFLHDFVWQIEDKLRRLHDRCAQRRADAALARRQHAHLPEIAHNLQELVLWDKRPDKRRAEEAPTAEVCLFVRLHTAYQPL
jgi:hypothetical protein